MKISASFFCAGGLAFLMSGAPALAVISGVGVDPARHPVAATQSVSISLTWSAVRDGGISPARGVNAGETVASLAGLFVDGAGRVLWRIERPLSQRRQLPSGGMPPSGVFLFQETVRVPTNVLVTARRGGQGLFYQRSFDDGFGAATARAELILTSASAAGFSLARLALRLDGGWVYRAVPMGADLSPRAQVTFSGSGQFRATWEIAEPASTALGAPRFRPLVTVRRFLTGGGEAIIQGPVLPTTVRGAYLVRLRIDAPEPGFPPPVLHYAVGGTDGPADPEVLRPLAPATGALLEAAVSFHWPAHPRAHAYQIEIRDATSPDAPPVTGVVVPAPRTEAVLPPNSRAHLRPGRYFWRLLAIDEAGTVVAASRPRELRVGDP